MEYAFAIFYAETAILQLKAKKKIITTEDTIKKVNYILNKEKRIIIAYIKIALHNIENDQREITVKEIEKQIQELKDLYTVDKLIEIAKNS